MSDNIFKFVQINMKHLSYHLAGATIRVANLVNYKSHPQEYDNTCPKHCREAY